MLLKCHFSLTWNSQLPSYSCVSMHCITHTSSKQLTANNDYSSNSSYIIRIIGTWGVFEQLNSWSFEAGLPQHGHDHSTNAQIILRVGGQPRHRDPHSKHAANVLALEWGPQHGQSYCTDGQAMLRVGQGPQHGLPYSADAADAANTNLARRNTTTTHGRPHPKGATMTPWDLL